MQISFMDDPVDSVANKSLILEDRYKTKYNNRWFILKKYIYSQSR